MLICKRSLILFLLGVFGADADEVKSVSVMEGDSVTLHTDVTDIQRDDQILWMFGPRDTRIAEIRNQKPNTYDETARYKGKLKLNNETGSLTITNISIRNSGLYKVEIINSKETSGRKFNVTVYDEVKSVMEGDSVTLHTDLTHIQTQDQILWMFGPRDTRIAEIRNQKPNTYDETARYGSKLKLNNETGSLTITNISIRNSGLYKVEIINSKETSGRKFNVTVYDASADNRSHVCAVTVAAAVVVLVVFIGIVVAVKQSRQRSHEEGISINHLNNDMRANRDEVSVPLAAANGVQHPPCIG
ncbi:putative CD48 antigen-like [Triplophysa rosa]|uniref:CD48 antigen-like n=1 Tax=Triplophysa rosa TaxID=992332 RepID=A0A9W7T475_TRIRA|nr:putative CD48 antigen-like [Triplophysa rosa]